MAIFVKMFEIRNIKHSYNGESSIEFPDMAFGPGEEWLILGPSGCGKTTLLHLMAGILPIQQGEVVLNAQSLKTLSAAQMDKFRGKHIGMIFQQSHFVASLNVLDNLILSQKLASKKNKALAIDLLNKLGLEDKLKQRPYQLSVGERQRVAIARALANKPQVILADEPTSALDDQNTDKVLSLLRENSKELGSTLIIVTHDNRLKEMVSNRIEL